MDIGSICFCDLERLWICIWSFPFVQSIWISQGLKRKSRYICWQETGSARFQCVEKTTGRQKCSHLYSLLFFPTLPSRRYIATYPFYSLDPSSRIADPYHSSSPDPESYNNQNGLICILSSYFLLFLLAGTLTRIPFKLPSRSKSLVSKSQFESGSRFL